MLCISKNNRKNRKPKNCASRVYPIYMNAIELPGPLLVPLPGILNEAARVDFARRVNGCGWNEDCIV